MNTLATQLTCIREAYAAGRAKQAIEVSDSDFLTNLEREWKAPLSTGEQELLTQCDRYRTSALQAARQGKYTIADYLFVATDKFIQSHSFSPAGSLIARSSYEAAASYLDYRRENFEVGTARIYRALALDATLEETYGYTHFHIHRIRLLLNLVRLKRRQGETKEALYMSTALVDYLEQQISTLPFPTSWNASSLEHLPFAQKNFLFEQAIFEIVFLVASQESVPADFLLWLDQHACSAQSTPCQLSPHSHLWLQARLALQNQSLERFLELLHPLVAAGPGKAIWLWYGVLADLIVVCRNLPLEQAHLLLQDIADDMPSWKWSGLPPSWKLLHQKIATHISM